MPGRDAYEALEAADLAEKGTWYMPGGWGDQTRCGLEAVRVVWSEIAALKAERQKRGR